MTTIHKITELAKQVIEENPETYPAPSDNDATEEYTAIELCELAKMYVDTFDDLNDLEEATNAVHEAYRIVYGLNN